MGRRMLNPGASSPATSADQARYWQERTYEAQGKLHSLHTSAGNVFGDPLYLVLDRALEAVTESSGEAFYHFDRVIEENQGLIAALTDQQRRANDGLIMCAERLLSRYSKARKPIPDDLLQVIVIAASMSGWDYLFPPHEHHRHDTDAGGACRNPICKYLSANEEPF